MTPPVPMKPPAGSSATAGEAALSLPVLGAAQGASPSPPGDAPCLGRTWTIELPAGLKLLSMNDMGNWGRRYRLGNDIRKAAWAKALQARIPHLERISLIIEYQPPTGRGRRDNENIPALSGKYCADGLVSAGVIPDDAGRKYITETIHRIGEPHPKGRLVLHITEVTP